MSLAIGLVIALFAAGVALLLNVPSAALIGPMVALGALSASGVREPSPVPDWLFSLALLVIGTHIGSTVTQSQLAELKSMWFPILGSIVVLATCGFVLAAALAFTNTMPFVDSVYATSPGAMSAILGMSAEAGANSTLVASFHVLRIFIVTAVTPFIISIFLRFSQQS